MKLAVAEKVVLQVPGIEVFGLGRQKIAIAMNPDIGSAGLMWLIRRGVFLRTPTDLLPPLLVSGALSHRPTGA